MRFSMIKRIISVLLISVMIVSYAIIAMGTTADDLNKAKDQKTQSQKLLDDTNAAIAKLKQESTDIASYVRQLDIKSAEFDTIINDLNMLIEEKEVMIVENEALLEASRIASAEQYAAMKLRIQYMYEHESESYLAILLASKDMGDMLNKAEYVNKITSYDREMLVKYSETVKLIETTEVTLETERKELEDSKASAQSEKDALSIMLREKDLQIQILKTKSDQANAYAADLDKAIKAEEATIAAMEAEMARQAAANTGSQPKYDGGMFMWPVPASTRITSNWQDREDRSAPHNGIDIGAVPAGTSGNPIVAAYDGVVTIAEYSSSAGNWIWINHGNGLYTVYMHNSALKVKVGDVVKKGQIISLMGNTGNSTGPHLHFGVRLNGTYVNPWGYVHS